MKHFLIFCLLALISISSISAQNRQLSIYNNDEELVFRVNLSDIGHIDILDNNSGDDNEDTEDPEPPVNNIPEGDGTEESPLNVTQAINYDNKDNITDVDGVIDTTNPVYVSGFIVGWSKYRNRDSIQFGIPDENDYNSNKAWIEGAFVIANSIDVRDISNCLIIESTDIKPYNLYLNPDNFNKRIIVKGQLRRSEKTLTTFDFMNECSILTFE